MESLDLPLINTALACGVKTLEPGAMSSEMGLYAGCWYPAHNATLRAVFWTIRFYTPRTDQFLDDLNLMRYIMNDRLPICPDRDRSCKRNRGLFTVLQVDWICFLAFTLSVFYLIYLFSCICFVCICSSGIFYQVYCMLFLSCLI